MMNTTPAEAKARTERLIGFALLTLILVCFIAAGLETLQRPGELSPLDTAGYLANAREIGEHGGRLGWLKRCFTGEWKTPNQMPLYLLFLSGLSYDNVDVLARARLVTLCIAAIGVVVAFSVARRIFGKPTAWLAAAALAINTAWLQHGTMVACEVLLGLLVTLAWCYLVKYLRGKKSGLKIGVTTGLALMTKVTAVLLLPAIFLIGLLKERRRILLSRQFWAGAAACFVICLPLLVRNARLFGNAFYSVTSAQGTVWVDKWSEAFQTGEHPQPPTLMGYLRSHSPADIIKRFAGGAKQQAIYLVVAAGQTYLFNETLGLKVWPFGLLVFALAAVTLFRKETRDASLAALVIGGCFFLFFSWFLIRDIRFVVPLVPMLLILASRGATILIGAQREGIVPSIAFVLAVSSGACAMANPNTLNNPAKVHHLPPGYFELHDWIENNVSDNEAWMAGLGQEYRYFWGAPLPGVSLPIPGIPFTEIEKVVRLAGVKYVIIDYSTVAGLQGEFAGYFSTRDCGVEAVNPPEDWVPVYRCPGDLPAYIIYRIRTPL